MWYAVQVETGREEETLAWIGRAAAEQGVEDAFAELFVPKRSLWERVGKAEWREREEPLFPGYLIASIDHRRDLARAVRALRAAPRAARMLSYDGAFAAIADDEVATICRFTGRDCRCVGVSEGFVEGGKVVVVSGALVGCEAMIRKVNRRKRTALVEFEFMGRTVRTEFALSLMRSTRDEWHAAHSGERFYQFNHV